MQRPFDANASAQDEHWGFWVVCACVYVCSWGDLLLAVNANKYYAFPMAA